MPLKTAELSIKLADAVQAAHERGIIHRDLKPANILLSATGEPKITDFGLAKNLEDDLSQTRSGQIMGTPTYMAPEQARGEIAKIGPGSDVYSLGAILFELLTGRTPFVGSTLVELLDQVRNDDPPRLRRFQPRLPVDLETICLKCLEKAPEKRYGTARDLADDLRRFVAGEPVRARRTPLVERGIKYVRRRPALAGFWMAVLVAVLVGGGWAVQHFLRQSYQTQLKLDATQLLFEIQTEIGNQSKKPWAAADWDRAASMVERVQGMIRSEPALESLAASATDLQFAVARAQEDQRTHQKKQEAAQAKFARFQRGLNDAMLNQMSNVGLKQQANLMTVRAVVPRALAEFGVSLDDDKLPDSSSPYLDDKQRASLVPSCYEMLLAWAGAVAQPLNQNKEEPQTQARKALAILDRAAKLGLDTKAYHMRRGSYLLVLGDQEGAKKELAISQKMEPTMASDYYLVGIEMYQSGPVLKEPMRTQVLRQAIEHLQKAVDLQPEHYWANYTLGQIYIHSSRWDAAVARLTACIQKNPNFPWPYPLRAHAHGMLGEYQLAEEDFAQAEKNLDDEEILYTVLVNRGFMYFRQAQGLEREPRKAQVARDRAVAHFRRAIDLRPKQFNAYANMAQLYQHEGKLNDAAVMLNRAIEYQPGVAALHRTRGRLHLRRRDYSSALADFQAAVQHSPTISSTLLADDHLECGRVLYRLRKFPEALAAFEQAVASHPGFFPRAQRMRAETLFELGRHREALAALERYLSDGGPPVGEVFLARGLVQSKLGNYPAAIEDYTVSLRADRSRAEVDDVPDDRIMQNTTALVYRGWAHLICESPFLADKDFTEALKLDARNSDALCGRGNARVLLGNLDGAVVDAEEAVKHGPASTRLLYNCCRVYARAVDKFDQERNFSSPDMLQRRRQYLQRSMQLLRDALEQMPPRERGNFWRAVIAPDPALKALQRHTDFLQLGQQVASQS